MDLTTSEKSDEAKKEFLLLTALLAQVGGNAVVQFGPENKPSDPLNGVRIARIDTMGGVQFRITSLDLLLRETASQYVQTIDEACKIAIARRKHYTRETPFRKLLKKPIVAKTWYLCERPADADQRNHSTFDPTWLRDAQANTLRSPAKTGE